MTRSTIKLVIISSLLIGWGLYLNHHPRNIGLHNGKLAPCPSHPNCVSSQSLSESHRVKPLLYPDDPKVSPLKVLESIVKNFPKTTIVEQRDNYMHVEFRSHLMSFVDDMEFLASPDKKMIQIRSASRVGWNDWGVNRKRVESIRKKYLEVISPDDPMF